MIRMIGFLAYATASTVVWKARAAHAEAVSLWKWARGVW